MKTNKIKPAVAPDYDAQNDYATSAVPYEKRKGFYATATVWVGWCVSLSAFATGATIASGSSLTVGLLAVLTGNIILAVLATLCGVIGFRTGRNTYSLYEAMFGSKGSSIVNFIGGISTMSFIGVLLDIFAETLNGLFPWFPHWAAIFVMGACILLTAINGFKGLESLSKIAAPALWILASLGLVLTIAKYPQNLVSWVPKAPIPFLTAVGAAVATWIGGASMASDLTRYSSKRSHIIGGTCFGYILGSGLFEGVAVVTAVGAGAGSLVVVMSSMGLLLPAAIVLGLALWTTSDNNIYSSALAFANASEVLGIKISKKTWTIVCVIIAVGVSFLGIADKFDAWLSFCGSLCGPLAGMMIAHFLILNRKSHFYVPTTYRLSGWITWIAASIGSQFSSFSSIPTVEAIILGFVIYIITSLIFDKKLNLHKDLEEDPQKGKVWQFPSSQEVASQVTAAKQAKEKEVS